MGRVVRQAEEQHPNKPTSIRCDRSPSGSRKTTLPESAVHFRIHGSNPAPSIRAHVQTRPPSHNTQTKTTRRNQKFRFRRRRIFFGRRRAALPKQSGSRCARGVCFSPLQPNPDPEAFHRRQVASAQPPRLTYFAFTCAPSTESTSPYITTVDSSAPQPFCPCPSCRV